MVLHFSPNHWKTEKNCPVFKWSYHLKTELQKVQFSNISGFRRVGFQIPTVPNFLKFGFEMIWSVCFAVCSRTTIQIPHQYIRKQDGVHLSGIPRVRLSDILYILEKIMKDLSTEHVWYLNIPKLFKFQLVQTSLDYSGDLHNTHFKYHEQFFKLLTLIRHNRYLCYTVGI